MNKVALHADTVRMWPGFTGSSRSAQVAGQSVDEMWARTYLLSEERNPCGGT